MLGTNNRWLAEGCLSYLFDKTYDNSAIKAYVSEFGGGITGLWDTRFFEELNTPEEVSMAKQMAHSLVVDLIDRHGISFLCDPIPIEFKLDWCKRMGLSEYFNEDSAEWLEDITFYWDSQYDIIAKAQGTTYYFNVGDAGLDNADIVEAFLYRSEYGHEYVMGLVSDENEQWMRDNSASVECIIYESLAQRMGGASATYIYIDKIVAFQHEQTHNLLTAQMQPLAVIGEGIAEYFDLVLYPYSYRVDTIRFVISETDRSSAWGVGFNNYCERGGRIDETDFDIRLYIDALAYYAFEHPGEPTSIPIIGTPMMELPCNINRALTEEGTELSYIQACSFVGYLVDRHGLDAVLDYIRLGIPFELAFDISFEQAVSDWETLLMGA